MTIQSKWVFSFLILIMILPWRVLAWNAKGHRIVASIAYQYLKPTARTQVDELVEDFQDQYPKFKTFDQMAVWPDLITDRQGHRIYAKWHYIDLPLKPHESKNFGSQNIVWALTQAVHHLRSPSTSKKEKAMWLAFMVHLMGDIHQPLHCIGRDGAGNFFHIPGKKAKNLHALWDKGLYDFKKIPLKNYTYLIISQYPQSTLTDAIHQLKPRLFAQEGYDISMKQVFKTPRDRFPSKPYLKRNRKIVQKRLALAGYRLAFLLNNILLHDTIPSTHVK